MTSATTQSSRLERIVLAGFMGSGKSTVGLQLALRLGWRFIDLDRMIALALGRTVPEIFAQEGESAFRAAEVRALTTLLQQPATVVALGGGAPGTPAIRELLLNATDTITVYLRAPFSVLYERCARQATDPTATPRPLLGDSAAAEARLEQRQPWYTAIAQHTTDADAGTPEQVAEALQRSLEARFGAFASVSASGLIAASDLDE